VYARNAETAYSASFQVQRVPRRSRRRQARRRTAAPPAGRAAGRGPQAASASRLRQSLRHGRRCRPSTC